MAVEEQPLPKIAAEDYTAQSPPRKQQVNNRIDAAILDAQRNFQTISESIQQLGYSGISQGRSLVDQSFPPKQREAVFGKVTEFALANPKTAASIFAFLVVVTSAVIGVNLALTGIPVLFFICFSLGVLIGTLAINLALALLGAVLVAAFWTGVGLAVLFPTVLFTTAVACFLSFCGLVAYFVLVWMTAEKGTAVERKQNGIKSS